MYYYMLPFLDLLDFHLYVLFCTTPVYAVTFSTNTICSITNTTLVAFKFSIFRFILTFFFFFFLLIIYEFVLDDRDLYGYVLHDHDLFTYCTNICHSENYVLSGCELNNEHPSVAIVCRRSFGLHLNYLQSGFLDLSVSSVACLIAIFGL